MPAPTPDPPASEPERTFVEAPTLPISARVELSAEAATQVGGRPAPPEIPPAGAPPPGPQIGDRRVGHYVIEGELGRGGMGVVYRAFDRDLRRHVAMKVMLREMASGEDVTDRFVEEAQATAQLQHPGIVPVYEIGINQQGRLFFTMKLVHGRTLAKVAADARAGDPDTAREFSSYRLLQVFVEVARTVAYAHERGVIHRDLKPQNVMVGRHGDVQVMDWGLAKVIAAGARPLEGRTPAEPVAAAAASGVRLSGERSETMAGAVVGTPAYMAPEQAEGDPRRMGPLADVYALGATLYHVLTGRAPFEGGISDVMAAVRTRAPRPPRALEPSVPREVEAICLKAMARAPSDRYASARLLADDVQAYLEGQSVHAYPEGLAGRALKWTRRHRGVTLTAAGALALALVLSVGGLVWIEVERRRAVAAERSAGERAREAEAERARAEAREREARLNLEQIFFEKAARALATVDMRQAGVLFAKALSLEDKLETRERLLEARAKGVRLEWANGSGSDEWVVAFGPDGRRLASAGADKTVRIWNAETGDEVAVLRGHEGPVQSVAFSPDGRRLASASFDGTVRLWSVEEGRSEAVLRGHEGRVWRVAFSPDGRRLASGGLDKTVRLWDLASRKEVLALPGHTDEVSCVAFSPDGRRLASSSWDETVRIWSVEDGACVRTLRGHDNWVNGVAFSPDGRELASAGEDTTVRLWDADTGQAILALGGHERRVNEVLFSPDGRWLASAGSDQTIRLWDIRVKREVLALRSQHGWVQSIGAAFSPDSRRLASAGLDHLVEVWDIDARDRGVLTLRGHERDVWAVAWSPDGRRLASASRDHTARIWDLERQAEALTLAHGDAVADVAWSPEGGRLVTGGTDRVVRTWDAASGRELAAMTGHEGDIDAVAFGPDGRRVASASYDGTIRVWDVATAKELRSLKHDGQVKGLAWSRDGRRLASGTPTIRVWDADTGAEVQALPGHELDVDGVSFSPDGRRLASASWDASVRIWDLAGGAPPLVLSGHQGWVYLAAFSPDGARLASAGEDMSVRLWDSATGKQLLAIGHEGEAIGVAFSPDGRALATGGFDRAVHVWDLAAVDRLLAAPPAELLRDAERDTGLRVEGLDLVPRPHKRGPPR